MGVGNVTLSDVVYVTIYNSIVNAKYDIDQKENGRITLNGNYNVYVEKGEPYRELGVIAERDGSDVTVEVITTGTVNTNIKGKYVITYTLGEINITRNVIVY